MPMEQGQGRGGERANEQTKRKGGRDDKKKKAKRKRRKKKFPSKEVFLEYAMDLQVGEDRAVLNCLLCNVLGRKSRSIEVHGESYIRWENVKRHHLCKHQEEWTAFKASEDKETYLAALRKKSQKGERRIEEFFITDDKNIEIQESDVKASVLFGLEDSAKLVKREHGRVYIHIKNPKQFRYMAQCIGTGVNYSAFTRLVDLNRGIRNCATEPEFNAIMRQTVGTLMRKFGIIAIRKLSGILKNAMGYSAAVDGSNVEGVTYFGIRVRVAMGGVLRSLYIGDIPLSETPPGIMPSQHIADQFATVIALLDKNWDSKLVGISTDGENKMFGRHNGFVRKIRDMATGPVLQVWCGAHQINVEVTHRLKNDTSCISDGRDFMGAVSCMVTRVNKKFPRCIKLWANTRWVTVKATMAKLVENADRYRALERREGGESETPKFWLSVLVLAHFTDLCWRVVKKLQASRLTLEEQRRHFQNLMTSMAVFNSPAVDGDRELEAGDRIKVKATAFDEDGVDVNATYSFAVFGDRREMSWCRGTLKKRSKRHGYWDVAWDDHTRTRVDEKDIVLVRKQSELLYDPVKVKKFIHDEAEVWMDYWDGDALYVGVDCMDAVVKFAGNLFAKTALGLRDRLESSSLGTATCGDVENKAPPVAPTEILEEKTQFLSLFRTFSDCGFLALVAEAAQSAVLVEYRTLRRAMESTLPTERCTKIRQVLMQLKEDMKEAVVPFRHAWDRIEAVYPCPNLRNYCTVMATVMPTTTQVESDFSRIGHIRHNRTTLSVFNVQCDMHAKQWALLGWVLKFTS